MQRGVVYDSGDYVYCEGGGCHKINLGTYWGMC